MSLSRVRTNLFQKQKARWLNPERSIGKFRGVKKGKLNCWEAEGPAKEAFEQIKPQIKELLERVCGPVPSSSFILFDIYMIGETEATAIPHIMFSCKRREPRKAAVAATQKSDIFTHCPPGICLGDWDYPPHLKDIRFLGSSAAYTDSGVSVKKEDNEDTPTYDAPDISQIFELRESWTARALQLEFRDTSAEPKYLCMATIGCIVELSAKRFYLAPAHIFTSQYKDSLDRELDPQPEDSECEFGGFDTENEPPLDEQGPDFMSQYSITPQSSDVENDMDLDNIDSSSNVDSDNLSFVGKVEAQVEGQHSRSVASEDDTCLTANLADRAAKHISPRSVSPDVSPPIRSDSLDYCLIEIDKNDQFASCLPVFSRASIEELESGAADVMTATGSGRVLAGVLSNRRSCIRLPNATEYIDALLAQFTTPPQPGDCGSIVRDANTGVVYGHIIAGDAMSQIAFVIPAVDVMNDIIANSTRIEAALSQHKLSHPEAHPGSPVYKHGRYWYPRQTSRKMCRKQSSRQNLSLENLPSVIKQVQFKCKEPGCKGRFKRQEHLKRHMKSHSKEKPHVCWVPGCHRAFARSDNLNSHYTKTHSKKGGRNRYVATLDETSPDYDPDFRGQLTPDGRPIYGSKLEDPTPEARELSVDAWDE